LIPQPPVNWVPPPRKESKGEPTFDEVDNPGDWKRYSFQPMFHKKTGMYLHPALPTKCTPVPLSNGERFSNEAWLVLCRLSLSLSLSLITQHRTLILIAYILAERDRQVGLIILLGLCIRILNFAFIFYLFADPFLVPLFS
jgi:hypothetical protein